MRWICKKKILFHQSTDNFVTMKNLGLFKEATSSEDAEDAWACEQG